MNQRNTFTLTLSHLLARRSMVGLTAAIGLGLLGCANSTATGAESVLALPGTEWQLAAVGSQQVGPTSKASLVFETESRIAGHGSCNRFSGSATVNKDHIEVGPLASTKMACSGVAMEQERAYLGALEKATKFERQGQYLLIHTSDPAQTLRFRRVL